MKELSLTALVWFIASTFACQTEASLSEGQRRTEAEKNLNQGESDSNGLSDEDLRRDLEYIPPELVGGTYLADVVCQEIEPSHLKIPNHLATVGCGFFRKKDKTQIDTDKLALKWNWNINGNSAETRELKLESGSRISAAFLMQREDINKGISSEVVVRGKDGQTAKFENINVQNGNVFNQNADNIINNFGGTININ